MFTRRLACVTAVAALCLGGLAAPAVAQPPPNDDVAAPTVVGVPDSLMQDTSEATVDASDPELTCAPPAGATVWFAFTPEADLRVEFNTFGSDYDTTLSAYLGMPSSETEVACNDDVAGDLSSRVRFDAAPGITYLIMVGSFGAGAGGSLVLQSDVAPPPLELAVMIDPRGTVVPRTGEVAITGTLTCSRPAMVGLEAGLTQRIGRARLEGYSGTGIECDGTTAWELSISAYNGLFTAGRAEAQAFAYGFDEDGYAEAFQQVRLTGGTPAAK
jgi:hypothetical protein